MPKSLITVFGGTGYVGSAIARALLARGFDVRAAARRIEQAGPRDDGAAPTMVQTHHFAYHGRGSS